MSAQAIGVFDSGVGGLSILSTLQKQLSKEQFIYVADSQHAPYGQLELSFLKKRCQYIIDFFIQQDVKAIVIACNTATAAIADWARKQTNTPIVALEPAVKPACEQTRNQRVGVFATQNTLNSQRYQNLIKTYASDCQVFESPCLGFVEQVEKGELDSPKTQQLIKENLQPMLEKGIDTLILGCTHYPFLSPCIDSISKRLGSNDLRLLDTAAAVAKQLSNILEEKQITQTNSISTNRPLDQYYTTANPAIYQPVFTRLMNQPVLLKQLD